MILFSLVLCGFSGCGTTPGIEEPQILECFVLVDELDCKDSLSGERITLPFEDINGMFAVSPEDQAEILNHHDALHEELNQCLDSEN